MNKSILLLLAMLIAGFAVAQSSQSAQSFENQPTQSGYRGMIELGFLSGKAKETTWNGYPLIHATPTVQFFNGYSFDPHFTVGFTSGIDFYNNIWIVPLALGIRGDFLPTRISPMYSLDVGHGSAFLNSKSNNFRSRGGWMFNPALGLRVKTGNNTAFTFTAGYKVQKVSLETVTWWWGGSNGRTEQKITYNRLSLRMGFIF